MQRFYYPAPTIEANVVEIVDPRIVFQATKVLRMKTGSQFTIFGDGDERVVEVLEINRRRILGNVKEVVKRNTESDLEVNLYQAIPKKTALFELVIQKATEIGVTQIFPLVTHRTQKNRLSKFERLQMIAIEATEQSNRTKVPIIRHPVSFESIVGGLDNAYLGYEYEVDNNLSDFLHTIQQSKKANILIGPEGGFDQVEIDLASAANIPTFSLGPRILRTETAAMSALSLILCQS